MKIIFSIFFILFFIGATYAQDILTLKNGAEIKAKVIEVGLKEVKYKKANNLEGPDFIIDKSEIEFINYKNGNKEYINKKDVVIQNDVSKKEIINQENVEGIKHINRKGESSLNLDLGVLTIGDFDKTYEWKGLEIGVSYLISLSKTINIGFETFLTTLSSKTFVEKNTNIPAYEYKYNYKLNALTLYAKSQFYWLNRPKTGMYSGLDIGYVTGTMASNLVSGYGRPAQFDLIPVAIQITFIGLKYGVANHWYGNYELGYGKRGIINIGLGYSL